MVSTLLSVGIFNVINLDKYVLYNKCSLVCFGLWPLIQIISVLGGECVFMVCGYLSMCLHACMFLCNSIHMYVHLCVCLWQVVNENVFVRTWMSFWGAKEIQNWNKWWNDPFFLMKEAKEAKVPSDLKRIQSKSIRSWKVQRLSDGER